MTNYEEFVSNNEKKLKQMRVITFKIEEDLL